MADETVSIVGDQVWVATPSDIPAYIAKITGKIAMNQVTIEGLMKEQADLLAKLQPFIPTENA